MLELADVIIIGLRHGCVPLAAAPGSQIDPLKIATNAETGGKVTVAESSEGVWETLRLNQFYRLLKAQVFYWSAIIILFLLVTMFFINKSEKLADRKADVLHKLAIAFIAASTLFLLSAVINVLDSIF